MTGNRAAGRRIRPDAVVPKDAAGANACRWLQRLREGGSNACGRFQRLRAVPMRAVQSDKLTPDSRAHSARNRS